MKYKGLFNFHGEITELYRHANSEAQAKSFFLKQLAEKYDGTVGPYFSGKAANYSINKEG